MTINEVKTAMDAEQLCIYKREIGYTQITPHSKTENLVVRIDWVSDPFPDRRRVIHVVVTKGLYVGERHILNEESIASRLTLGSNEREGEA